jgi:hypothetical protein
MARSRTLLVAAGALVLDVGALAWLRPRASDGPTPDAGPTAPIAAWFRPARSIDSTMRRYWLRTLYAVRTSRALSVARR